MIQELLKEIAQTQQVDLNAKQRFKGLRSALGLSSVFSDVPTVVIINEADSLSRDAQAALRRTMEKYMSNMRIILCANSTSRLIAPIKSRCLLMRVAAPSDSEVGAVPRFAKIVLTCLASDGDGANTRSKARVLLPAARSCSGYHQRFRRESPQGHSRLGSAQDAIVRPLPPSLISLTNLFRPPDRISQAR